MVLDEQLYNVPEYWANALETVSRRKGDCEDVAILKGSLLHYLGFPKENLKIGIVDVNGENDWHAVLLAKYEQDWFVLDNLFERAIPVKTYKYKVQLLLELW